MNLATFERAQVAAFAYCRARHTGSIECMRAICYVLRNRLRAGWGNGSWIHLIEHSADIDGNVVQRSQEIDPQDRLLQLLVRDIDDIYLGQSSDDTRTVIEDNKALYYVFIRDPISDWFRDKIIRDPVNHARIAGIGPIDFYK